jgi:hypothetical protein
VRWGVIGVPSLLAEDNELFEAFSSSPDLIATMAMRAAIAFKWKAFARKKWIAFDGLGISPHQPSSALISPHQPAVPISGFGTFLLTNISGLYLLLAGAPDGTRNVPFLLLHAVLGSDAPVHQVAGAALYSVSLGWSSLFLLEESRQMRSLGRRYFVGFCERLGSEPLRATTRTTTRATTYTATTDPASMRV